MLFITTNDLNDDSGVAKKIRGQVKAMRKSGINIKILYPDGDKVFLNGKEIDTFLPIPFVRLFIILSTLYRNAEVVMEEQGIHHIYLRHSMFEWSLIQFLKKMKRKGVRVFIEFPTFPYDDEYRKKLSYKRFGLLVDRVFRKSINKYVDYMFTPSVVTEKKIFNVPVLRFDNGVDSETIAPRRLYKRKKGVIRLVGVANLSYWHGYDRVIKGVSEYYKNGGTCQIIFNVVGDGDEYEKLAVLTKELHIEYCIKFHGRLLGDTLDKVCLESDIGVGALGAHRKKIFHLSSLKAREYCLRSLPFLIVKDIDKDFKDFRYVISVKPDDTIIDIDYVIEEFEKMNPSEYLPFMRKYGEKNLSWNKKFEGVISKIKN